MRTTRTRTALAGFAAAALMLTACTDTGDDVQEELDEVVEDEDSEADEQDTGDTDDGDVDVDSEPDTDADDAEHDEPADEPDEPAEDEPAEDEADEEAGEPEDSLVALGDQAAVGDWLVTVTDVNLDATEEVLAANQFNEEPDGVYILVSLEGTFEGDADGQFWLDVSATYEGSDNRQYRRCDAVPPDSMMDEPTVSAGGTVSGTLCFEVPTDAVEGGQLFMEDPFAMGRDRAEARVFFATS